MIRDLLIYRAPGTEPTLNLALEARLLETVPADCCILYLWRNANTVVIGRNQNAWAECDVAKLQADGGTLARRLSGGGAVYHDLGNLNFTFLVGREDEDRALQDEVIINALGDLGIHATRSGRNDLLVDGRKFSGHAYLEQDGHCYHHGTLLLDVDVARMQRYLTVNPAKLAGKGVASVRQRVMNLVEVCPGLTAEVLQDALIASFSQVFAARYPGCGTAHRLEEHPLYRRATAGGFEGDDGVEELRKRFASWDWRFGRKIPFTARCAGRFPWGGAELQLQVEGGIVEDVRIYTDALDVGVAEQLEMVLRGRRFSSTDLTTALRAARVTYGGHVLDAQVDDLCGLVVAQGW